MTLLTTRSGKGNYMKYIKWVSVLSNMLYFNAILRLHRQIFQLNTV